MAFPVTGCEGLAKWANIHPDLKRGGTMKKVRLLAFPGSKFRRDLRRIVGRKKSVLVELTMTKDDAFLKPIKWL